MNVRKLRELLNDQVWIVEQKGKRKKKIYINYSEYETEMIVWGKTELRIRDKNRERKRIEQTYQEVSINDNEHWRDELAGQKNKFSETNTENCQTMKSWEERNGTEGDRHLTHKRMKGGNQGPRVSFKAERGVAASGLKRGHSLSYIPGLRSPTGTSAYL